MIDPVISDAELASIDKPALLAIVQSLRDELAFKQKVIDKITHEMAVLKRLKFSALAAVVVGGAPISGIGKLELFRGRQIGVRRAADTNR
jgi:hypothetical protein